mmetsp:Transcript_90567/g.270219  ORF Transcript_90567/g.270219 Transcript_90567/m.270219 type:complete len:494 (-) Transcript_90567:83-1564(-)
MCENLSPNAARCEDVAWGGIAATSFLSDSSQDSCSSATPRECKEHRDGVSESPSRRPHQAPRSPANPAKQETKVVGEDDVPVRVAVEVTPRCKKPGSICQAELGKLLLPTADCIPKVAPLALAEDSLPSPTGSSRPGENRGSSMRSIGTAEVYFIGTPPYGGPGGLPSLFARRASQLGAPALASSWEWPTSPRSPREPCAGLREDSRLPTDRHPSGSSRAASSGAAAKGRSRAEPRERPDPARLAALAQPRNVVTKGCSAATSAGPPLEARRSPRAASSSPGPNRGTSPGLSGAGATAAPTERGAPGQGRGAASPSPPRGGRQPQRQPRSPSQRRSPSLWGSPRVPCSAPESLAAAARAGSTRSGGAGPPLAATPPGCGVGAEKAAAGLKRSCSARLSQLPAGTCTTPRCARTGGAGASSPRRPLWSPACKPLPGWSPGGGAPPPHSGSAGVRLRGRHSPPSSGQLSRDGSTGAIHALLLQRCPSLSRRLGLT